MLLIVTVIASIRKEGCEACVDVGNVPECGFEYKFPYNQGCGDCERYGSPALLRQSSCTDGLP